jgi:hypothetical protein
MTDHGPSIDGILLSLARGSRSLNAMTMLRSRSTLTLGSLKIVSVLTSLDSR